MHHATCNDVRILVYVPFTSADVPLLLCAHSLWARFLPCNHLHKSSPRVHVAAQHGLLLFFNHRCTALSNCSHVINLVRFSIPISVRDCFHNILVRDAKLSGTADKYDKSRQGQHWTMGPNNLFHYAVGVARRLGYSHMMQIEPDVLPFRKGWLDEAACVAQHSFGAWVIGSPLRANCTQDEVSGICAKLPLDIAGHINGNAIYSIGDDEFSNYLQEARKDRFAKLPYDLAVHLLQRTHRPALTNMHFRFRYSEHVLNFGSSMPDNGPALRARFPSGYLVHSSAFTRLREPQLVTHLVKGIRFKSQQQDRPSIKNHHRIPQSVNLDLSLLHERSTSLSDGSRCTIVTFVAGTRYRHLCRNHVLHLKRAHVMHYVMVALDALSLKWLREAREPTIDSTHVIRNIPESGSDRFGSFAFFAINGARYRTLLAMLSSGISLFVLDLDAVVLSDPIDWMKQHEEELISSHPDSSNTTELPDILLQSDARDGTTLLELDPDLLERRLGLLRASSWPYANGGTFFCRATSSTRALFSRVWARLLSGSRGTPLNEQDVLNRELAAGGLRWGILPPSSFPNGFVHFVRPIADPIDAVVVHANWINGIEAKIYHLREAGLWALPHGRSDAGGEKLLSIDDGTDHGPQGALGFAAHWQTLIDALGVAQALNRTLVLPHLPLSRAGARRGEKSRSLAQFFDYPTFARAFPQHRAHGPELGSSYLSNGVVKIHLEIGRGDAPPYGHEYYNVRVPSQGKLTTQELCDHLQSWASARELRLWTPFQRLGKLIDTPQELVFATKVREGIRPAPRLNGLAQHLYRSIRRATGGSFDCIDASASIENDAVTQNEATKARTAILKRPQHLSWLPLREAALSINSTSSSSYVLIVSDKNMQDTLENRKMARALLGPRAFWMDDHIPPWHEANLDTPSEKLTHARALVELLTCARASRFIGSFSAPSTLVTCLLHEQHYYSKRRGNHDYDHRWCQDVLGRDMPEHAHSFSFASFLRNHTALRSRSR